MGTAAKILFLLSYVTLSLGEDLGYEWISRNENQSMLDNAVLGGTKDAEHRTHKLYVARALHQGELIPGKLINPTHSPNSNINAGEFYLIYNNEHHRKYEFQVLAGPDKFAWVKMSVEKDFPENVIRGGEKADGTAYYVGRAKHDGKNKELGIVDSSNKILYTKMGASSKTFNNYELLVWHNDEDATANDGEFVSKRNNKLTLVDLINNRLKQTMEKSYPIINNVTIHAHHWNFLLPSN